MENKQIKEQSNPQINDKELKINDINDKVNQIDEKIKYLEEIKNNFDQIIKQGTPETLLSIDKNQEILDKKMNYLKLNQELYNIKKPEISLKLQLKNKLKNIFIEDLSNNNNNNENIDNYFQIDMEAFNYGNNNKNNLYQSEGLLK